MSEYLERLFSLKGRVAIVNNVSTELGQAVTLGLAQSGAMVCGTDSQLLADEQLETEERMSDSNRYSKFKLLCDEIYEKYSKFNLLVNIEKIDTPSVSLETIDLASTKVNNFRQAVEMQLHNANQAIAIAAQKFEQSGGGLVINIISIENAMGFPDYFSYIATKNALLMITKKLAIDLIKDNIRVNNIVLGYVDDDIKNNRQAFNLSERSYQDLIKAIIYFASENSGSVTGQDIFIVGNRTIINLV